MSGSVKELFVEMKKILSDPKRWTKNINSRDARGVACNIDEGVCFCLYGAQEKAFRNLGGVRQVYEKFQNSVDRDADVIMSKLAYETADVPTSTYNDLKTTTHEDIMKFLDTCIERAGG